MIKLTGVLIPHRESTVTALVVIRVIIGSHAMELIPSVHGFQLYTLCYYHGIQLVCALTSAYCTTYAENSHYT